MKYYSLEEIKTNINILENKYELFEIEFQGVKTWQIIRNQVYNEILNKINNLGDAHTSKNTKKDLFRSLFSYSYYSIMKNPLLSNKQKDILVFEHPRKIKIEEEYIDIYTHHILKKFEKGSYEILERDYMRKHFRSSNLDDRSYLDYYYILTIWKRLRTNINFNINERAIINSVEEEINNKYNIKINLMNLFKNATKKFKLQFSFYERIFLKRRPKKVYLVVSYVNHALVAAAKKYKIETIELQHGVITPYHLGYNFPKREKPLEYFPDKLQLFGEYWKDSVEYPIPIEQIEVTGFPYLTEKIKRYQMFPKKQNQIVFISQGTIGRYLSSFAFKVAKLLNDFQIIYKLHPGEYDRWKVEYPDLIKAEKLKNFQVIDNSHTDLYEILATSSYQIGIYSTALFEGLEFKCKTYVIDFIGIEHLTPLIENKLVEVVRDETELVHNINNKMQKFKEGYFFFKEHSL